MLRFLRRQLLVALATVAGGIGLSVILVMCSPSGTPQTAELQETTAVTSTAMPTAQPPTPASSSPTATDNYTTP
jgi:hypothetical protein